MIDALATGLVRPVRWCDALAQLEADGLDRHFVAPPARVLRGLVRRTLDPALVASI
ncbi:MAG: hypothetical protein OHK0013_29630 [Sandaracinaceae bacterium]